MPEGGGRWGKAHLGQGGGMSERVWARWSDQRKVLGNRNVRSMFLPSLVHIIPLYFVLECDGNVRAPIESGG